MQYKQTGFGPSLAVDFWADDTGITKVKLTLSEGKGLKWRMVGSQELEKKVEAWIEAYLQKSKKMPTLPVALNGLTFFTLKVYEALKKIPPGAPLSYAEVAEKIDHPRAYRAVGTACSKNPCPLIIPCHRVLASGGKLGGFTGGLEIKKRLLAFEK